MNLILIPFLVAVASAIILPASSMDHNPQAVVEGKIEERESQVS